ncbi:Transducin family protein / WD-40 repeat family protein [Rhynchospora pubera]|uniref:Transducin family protein / WD-40 repeat family protein n=1 Tax=Rhynchospora pubera TaxID=906938 RepID=A0AAV8GUJ1_9POAL|nr:Transducin family protein / WD-40 repeat family protein [Rhynchospora pubera]
MKKSGEGSSLTLSVDERYKNWKSLIPVLYDWFANHNLVWPSLSCRFLRDASFHVRGVLLTDGSMPNTLIIVNCEVVKPRVAAAEHISEFNEEARSPFVKKYKTLIHPGEVNRIRELPQNNNIVATHTDSPDVLIWDLEAQPNRHPVIGASESIPDVILTGHTENATEFALAMSPAEPFVISGGRDNNVVLWSIQDAITSLGLGKSGVSSFARKESLRLGPRGVFEGHDAAVEDVQFCPSSVLEFCSVGDDSCLILWDARSGNAPIVKVEKAHDDDLHCVDWNTHDTNLILTGSADNTVRIFDRRNLTAGGVGSPIYKFEGHNAPILSIQWCPDIASVFASGAEDGFLNIWDYDKVGNDKETTRAKARPAPPGLFFQHGGHRDKIVDFHWNPAEPWTIASISDDVASTGGGGTLQICVVDAQIWRISDLIYRPEEEVIAELTKFKEHLTKCGPSETSKSSD